MDIQVCIGSCCHKRSSYSIIKKLKSMVKENEQCDSINVCSAFCLGNCKDGVTIKVNEQIITGITMENIEDVFYKYVDVKNTQL